MKLTLESRGGQGRKVKAVGMRVEGVCACVFMAGGWVGGNQIQFVF